VRSIIARLPLPSIGKPQAPLADETRRRESRIKLDVALGQPLSAGSDNLSVSVVAFREVTEALENSAVADAVGVGDQGLRIGVRTGPISPQALGDVAYAAARCGVVEQIDDRAVDVGDLKLHAPPPQRSCAEHLLRRDVPNDEGNSLNGLVSPAYGADSVDEHRAEQLLRQVPTVCRAGAPDVTGIEDLDDNRPWVFQNLVAGRRCERNGRILISPLFRLHILLQ
jgi:hypothetical protein